MALEMARMCVLAAPMIQAEPKAVTSMTGVDRARSSAAGIVGEVAHSLFVELILTAGLART